jgi:3-dehydroquinate synthase
VSIGIGILRDLAEHLRARCPAARYVVIADSGVAPLLGDRVREAAAGVAPTDLVTFPAGEWNKTREMWAHLSDELLKRRVGRDGAIIALGGGVTGDLAGFVAATYLRGVPYVQVPTTLLAMIDSSIGGKTGVDVPAGKNLIGSFHQPRAVLADVETLVTLPPIQLSAGMAEALKHGVVADAHYFEWLVEARRAIKQKDLDVMARVVVRSVEIKAAVVAGDERERGIRAILNFGHTIGHALEAVSGFELLHGEAVGLGMAAEARLAHLVGIADQSLGRMIAEALEAFDLPVRPNTVAPVSELLDIMATDKKSRAETVRFALPERIGTMARGEGGEWTIAVPRDAIERVMEELA